MAAFLQNHGDIILDAVLTDYGRKLLAKGDGSFNIVKFALGDDEIDYGLYDANANTLNQDILIMNTPILEAFTNNAASMKSQLLTMAIENIMYLPVLKLASGNSRALTGKFGPSNSDIKFEGYVIPVEFSDSNSVNSTTSKLKTSTAVDAQMLTGVQSVSDNFLRIVVHQGLDSSELDPKKSLMTENPALYEEEYSVYIDSRFCSLVDLNDPTNTLSPLSVDDDGIAVYKFTQDVNASENSAVSMIPTNQDINSPIAGTKGSVLQFKIVPNNNLKNQDTYFTKYGKTLKLNPNPDFNTVDFLTVRMPVRVIGATTGYSLEIPVMFAKYDAP